MVEVDVSQRGRRKKSSDTVEIEAIFLVIILDVELFKAREGLFIRFGL